MEWVIGQIVGREEEKNKGEKGEKRMCCKHLLITFCRIETHTSYSVTEREAVGDVYVTTDMLGCRDMHDPAWHDLGVTQDLRQHRDVSRFLSTKKKLGHQKQHGAHSSTTLPLTKPPPVHSHTLLIFKYAHVKDALVVAYAVIKALQV